VVRRGRSPQSPTRRSPVTAVLVPALIVVVLVPAGSAADKRVKPTSSRRGVVMTQFRVPTKLGPLRAAGANDLTLQHDGKIVAVGGSFRYGASATRLALARYKVDGSLDATFGGDGKVTTRVGSASPTYAVESFASAVAAQPDGRIVVAGRSEEERFDLVRYNPNGALDRSFGGRGSVHGYREDAGTATALALQPDGKIVAAGYGGHCTPDCWFILARVNRDGSPDTGFDGDGSVETGFGGREEGASDVALQPDGKIVAVGASCCSSPDLGFVIARYAPDGSLDSNFGTDGTTTTLVGLAAGAHAVALQPDGKIIVAGDAVFPRRKFAFVLARYNPDGSLDTSFDNDGKVTALGKFSAGDVAVQPDGKIVAAGSKGSDLALRRYNADGSLDTGFDRNGEVATAIGGKAGASALAIQSDGKIVAAGGGGIGDAAFFAVARYIPDGSLDTRFGPPACLVPDVRGLPVRRAKTRLSSAGCRIGTISRSNSTMSRGRVFRQSARPGTRLPPQFRVRLRVSRGATNA
jgi:uncharacterized delta-60 repeat protein